MPTTSHQPTSRFSGRCDHCIYPIVIDNPEIPGNYTSVPCPGCTTTVRLERLFGVFSETGCDSRCQFALGPICECACGGANHQAGYLSPVQTGELPASLVDQYRATYARRQDGARRAGATRRANRAVREAELRAAFLSDFPQVADAFARAAAGEFAEVHEYAQRTITDIAQRFETTGRISERQVSFVLDLVRQAEARRIAAEATRARMAAEATQAVAIAPEGRTNIVGVIVFSKMVEGAYGDVVKMLVRCGDEVSGFYKVWMSTPAGITFERFDVIEAKVTLTRSDRDDAFAFGKRPSNAAIIGHAEVSAEDVEDSMSPMEEARTM